jgi:hypothetical protein
MARAKKGEIRDIVRDLKASVAELLDAITADGGKAVVLALQQAEDDLEEVRELCEDRYPDAFEELEPADPNDPNAGEEEEEEEPG